MGLAPRKHPASLQSASSWHGFIAAGLVNLKRLTPPCVGGAWSSRRNTLVLSWEVRVGTPINKENWVRRPATQPESRGRPCCVLEMTPRPDWGRGARKKVKGPGLRHFSFTSQSTHTGSRASVLTRPWECLPFWVVGGHPETSTLDRAPCSHCPEWELAEGRESRHQTLSKCEGSSNGEGCREPSWRGEGRGRAPCWDWELAPSGQACLFRQANEQPHLRSPGWSSQLPSLPSLPCSSMQSRD